MQSAADGRIEETLLPWLSATLDAICPYLPGPSEAPLADSALLPPAYRFEPALDLRSLSLADEPAVATDGKAVSVDADAVYCPPGWEWGTLRKNARATAPGWWQDVREIELETPAET